MKCKRYAVLGWKSKKGMKYSPKVLCSFPSLTDVDVNFPKLSFISHAEECNGEIESKIELEYIPYMGGADPNVEVRFKCNRCGWEYAGENGLPYDIDTLNKFLTEVIKDI